MKRIAQHTLAGIIVFGALNWGFMGLFDINLITWLFGEGSLLSKIAYVLLGTAGLLFAVLEANEHAK